MKLQRSTVAVAAVALAGGAALGAEVGSTPCERQIPRDRAGLEAMRRIASACALVVLTSAAPVAGAQVKAHRHGVARLDLAIEPKAVVARFDSPLDNLTGLERSPHSKDEKKNALAAVMRLENGAQMLRIDPAAGCRFAGVTLTAPVLGLGGSGAVGTAKGGHADLGADYRFDCTDATRAAWIDVGLFDFVRLQRLQVRLVTVGGQHRRELTPAAVRLALPR
jgi:hypothetical protein